MDFSSNAEEIRFYVMQFLSDYKQHTRKEIQDYLKQATPNGVNFTDGMITGALRTLTVNSKEYVNTGWGQYRRIPLEELHQERIKEEKQETVLKDRLKEILEQTKAALNTACLINILEINEADAQAATIAKKVIKSVEEALIDLDYI